MQGVLISLSSYGAAEVRRHGQLWFTRLAQAAGADGVEVRGELLVDPARELPELAAAIAEAGLQSVYSSPEGLWRDDGVLDVAALARALETAVLLGSPRLKMAIGGFRAASAESLPKLKQQVHECGVELLIENDQTAWAGTLRALDTFFARADAAGLRLPMTFDMGNWHWTGECPLQAAASLAARVAYVHCKGVQRQPGKWIAVPLADSSAPWRAILRAMPSGVPWAIEYPLVGNDLLAVTRAEIAQLRSAAAQGATA
jgi:sugar phosphate isomerase/epimerase